MSYSIESVIRLQNVVMSFAVIQAAVKYNDHGLSPYSLLPTKTYIVGAMQLRL